MSWLHFIGMDRFVLVFGTRIGWISVKQKTLNKVVIHPMQQRLEHALPKQIAENRRRVSNWISSIHPCNDSRTRGLSTLAENHKREESDSNHRGACREPEIKNQTQIAEISRSHPCTRSQRAQAWPTTSAGSSFSACRASALAAWPPRPRPRHLPLLYLAVAAVARHGRVEMTETQGTAAPERP